MKFDQDFIEKVREASNIVDVISQHVELKKSGSGYLGLCPFHGEKTPSFSVSEDKQVYHCFGCKASGNVYTFVQNLQGLTFPETVEYLAKRAGIAIPEAAALSGGSRSRSQKEALLRVNQFASLYFHKELLKQPLSSEIWQYLTKRGLSRQDAEDYKLGYAPQGWTGLVQAMERSRVPLHQAEQLGLLKARGADKSGHYDLFRHRMMFPIFSPTGGCVGFGGRVLGNDQPKYLNSPDSPVFHKGQVFYGLDRSAKHIRSQDRVIVVEGYMDWLALDKAGLHNVVATLGTALTENHARLLKRYTHQVVVLFDGDEAGQSAARRSLPILLGEGLYAKGLFLPDGLDPDDFIKSKGADALKSHVDTSRDLYDVILEEEVRQHRGEASEKVRILDRLAAILRAIPDARLQNLYVQNTAMHLDVDAKLVRGSLKTSHPSRPQPAPPLTPATVAPPSQATEMTDEKKEEPKSQPIEVRKVPRVEQELLNVALLKEVYLKEVMDSGVLTQLTHPGLKMVFERLTQLYRQMPNKFDNLSALLASEVQPTHVVTMFMSEPYQSLVNEAAEKLIHDCIKRIKENFMRGRMRELVTDLRGAHGPDQKEKLEQIMNIQRNRRQLNKDN